MKKLSVIIISFIAVFSFSGIAIAIPIEFDVSGSSSSVMITDINKWGWTGISATKVSSLGDTPFTLNDGDSQTFDFFTVNVGGFGGGTAHILATLAFDKPPDATNADGTGYVGWIIAGVLGEGGPSFGTSQRLLPWQAETILTLVLRIRAGLEIVPLYKRR